MSWMIPLIGSMVHQASWPWTSTLFQPSFSNYVFLLRWIIVPRYFCENFHIFETTNHSPVPGPLAFADVPSSRVLSMIELHPMQQLARLLHDLQTHPSIRLPFFRWPKKRNLLGFQWIMGGLSELFFLPWFSGTWLELWRATMIGDSPICHRTMTIWEEPGT